MNSCCKLASVAVVNDVFNSMRFPTRLGIGSTDQKSLNFNSYVSSHARILTKTDLQTHGSEIMGSKPDGTLILRKFWAC